MRHRQQPLHGPKKDPSVEFPLVSEHKPHPHCGLEGGDAMGHWERPPAAREHMGKQVGDGERQLSSAALASSRWTQVLCLPAWGSTTTNG